MIIFHEGLPRSGKTYEACIWLIEWIRQGHKIVTNIEGLDFDRIAHLCNLTPNQARASVRVLTSAEMERLPQSVPLPGEDGQGGEKDLYLILDEIQDVFPCRSTRLDAVTSKWFASHGHAGWHMLLLGQDSRDVHTLIRRRIQRRIVFTKLTGVGLEDRYKWEAYEAVRPEKFQAMGSGTKRYDPTYFGVYKSHVQGTEQTGALMDSRANVFKQPVFRVALAGFVLFAVLGTWGLTDFFSHGPVEVAQEPVPEPAPAPPPAPARAPTPVHPSASVPPVSAPAPEPPPPPPDLEQDPIDYLDALARKYRLRLSGLIMSLDDPGKVHAVVEIIDDTFHLKESFSLQELRDMGWQIDFKSFGLILSTERSQSGARLQHVVRPWPIDPFGRTSDRTRDKISG